MSSSNKAASSQEKIHDDRGGLRFGADTAYDSDSEYVSALPTDEEERLLRAGENVKAKETGRYSKVQHPLPAQRTSKLGLLRFNLSMQQKATRSNFRKKRRSR